MIGKRFILEDTMATHPTSVTLQAHHAYRSWSCSWYDDKGKRRTKRFGKERELSAKAARAAYQNWLSTEWNDKEHVRNPEGEEAHYTVAKLAEDYEAFAPSHYIKNGVETSFMSQVKSAMKRLRDAYGPMKAAEIDAPMIAKLRDKMIQSEPDNEGKTRPLTRGTVNDRLHIIKQAFSWSHSEKGRVSLAVAWSISTVKALAQGRSTAKESEAVPPIADWVVDAVKPHLSSVIADMMTVQRLTGMRPEEACIIRSCDIEANGDVWLYRPGHHKTEHHNKNRVIPVGPQCQEVIRRRLKPNTLAYLFSPFDALAEWQAKTKQKMRTRAGEMYTTRSYRQAIHRGCCRAKVDEFNPNQLRHTWASEIRKRFDLESAAIGLGHSDLRTAEIYAERYIEKAKEVARKVG